MFANVARGVSWKNTKLEFQLGKINKTKLYEKVFEHQKSLHHNPDRENIDETELLDEKE